MTADTQTVTIDLEPMAQPRLHDTLAVIHLGEQPMDVGDQIPIDIIEMGGDDRTEEQTAESGDRIDGQDQVPERHPASWCDGTRVPHLQLGQQHLVRLLVIDPRLDQRAEQIVQ
jgi:hypothetical protein